MYETSSIKGILKFIPADIYLLNFPNLSIIPAVYYGIILKNLTLSINLFIKY